MYEPGSGNCKAKVGLLVLRECKKTASAACSLCGIPVCAKHQAIVSQGVACPNCASNDPNYKDSSDSRRWRRRSRYYDNYHYYPYYYDHHHGYYHDHYHDRDYHSVENRDENISEEAAAAGTSDAEVMDDSDFDDFDSMES